MRPAGPSEEHLGPLQITDPPTLSEAPFTTTKERNNSRFSSQEDNRTYIWNQCFTENNHKIGYGNSRSCDYAY
jgi:hypothetical protein